MDYRSSQRYDQLTVSQGRLEIRFLGRRAPTDRQAAFGEQSPEPRNLAFLNQVHSTRVVEATPGCCGEADALWTRRDDLALSVVTADCVPLVVADQRRLAVVHAGWRGIAGGIVGRTIEALGKPEELSAWIGPAIGPCCYEVGDEVAHQLVAASSISIAAKGPRGRPHVDLAGAIVIQLIGSGIAQVHKSDVCTRCQPQEFWSYRYSGPKAGRNFTFAWLDGYHARFASDRSPGP